MTAAFSLYHGRVAHRRLRPVGHRFSYRVFSMLIDIDRIDEADKSLRFFSRNRFNLFSFHDNDFAGEDDAPLAARVRAALWGAGLRGDGRIEVLCYPRILGYVFNPLSVFYCRDAEARLEAIIYEVRNTFGGVHSYLVHAQERDGRLDHSAAKALHVSPFMDMNQRYHFTLTPPAEKLAVVIRQTDSDGPIFNASFAGDREAASDAALLRAFFRYPLMTVKVIAAIHWEALRLFGKGLRLKKAPPEPEMPVTVIAPAVERRSRAA